MNVNSSSDTVPSQLPRLVVYVPSEIKDKFEVLSERERRSMSQMVVHLMERAIQEAESAGTKLN
jgi:hypothetical protein